MANKLTNHERNKDIFRRWRNGERQTEIAERYGITPERVHAILKEMRKAIPEQTKEEFVSRELEMLDAIRKIGMEIAEESAAPAISNGEVVYDEKGNVVRDHSGRLAGARLAADMGKELRKLLGLDSATKHQVEQAVRYILEGVPEDEDV